MNSVGRLPRRRAPLLSLCRHRSRGVAASFTPAPQPVARHAPRKKKKREKKETERERRRKVDAPKMQKIRGETRRGNRISANSRTKMGQIKTLHFQSTRTQMRRDVFHTRSSDRMHKTCRLSLNSVNTQNGKSKCMQLFAGPLKFQFLCLSLRSFFFFFFSFLFFFFFLG